MIQLGVNIDHIATLRQARGTRYPSPVQAALLLSTLGLTPLHCIYVKIDAIFKIEI